MTLFEVFTFCSILFSVDVWRNLKTFPSVSTSLCTFCHGWAWDLPLAFLLDWDTCVVFVLFQPYGVLGSLGFGCQTSGTIPFGYKRLWIWLAGVWLRPFCVYVIDRCSSGDASCTFVSSSFWKRSLFHFFPPKSLNSRWQFCFKCLVNYYSSVTCFRYCVTTSFVLSFHITFGFFTFCTFMVNCDPK